MAAPADPLEMMRSLMDALGLTGRALCRLVIVCDVEEPVQVYYKELLRAEAAAPACEALAAGRDLVGAELVEDVQVDDNANVFIVPQEKEHGPPTNP